MANFPTNIRVTISSRKNIVKVRSQKSLEKQFKPYAIELGKLVYAWNRLHESLADLFWAVTGIKNGNVPLSIWYSTPNDRTQREMLRAATAAIFSDPKNSFSVQAKKDIMWLTDKVNSFANRRNDAIHAPLTFFIDAEGSKLNTAYFNGNPRALALKDKDLIKEFTWYRICADVLWAYSSRIRHCLRMRAQGNDETPWPDRPQLPNLVQSPSRKTKRHQKRGK